MRLNSVLFFCFCFFATTSAFAQVNAPPGYYIFPIQPGQPNFLAGTMGELRNNHFHAGIDIKTGGVEGFKVYAAAAGYISRINVSSYGYGNALYVQHDNGTTTVYGHLLDFNENIGDYVRQQQYKRESFSIELYPDKNQFPVKQGDIIALSGNSGSSGGPHLHFEIRDASQKPLNPLKYNFKEIKDNIPPTAVKIALKTMALNARVNGQFGRFEFDVVKQGNNFVIKEPIEVHGKIGFEILAYDQLNGVPNQNGVPCIEFYKDNQKVFEHDITTFSFAESRNILMHTNYGVSQTTGKRYTKLYLDDGNELQFYTVVNNGVVALADSSRAEMVIKLSDAYENSSTLTFTLIEGDTKPVKNTSKADLNKAYGYYIMDNFLVFFAQVTNQTNLAKLYTTQHAVELSPVYQVKNKAVYLWDLRAALPDSVDVCNENIAFNFETMAPSNKETNFFHPAVDINIPKRALFDTAYLQVNYKHDMAKKLEVFEVGDHTIPFRMNAEITLKPILEYPNQQQVAVYAIDKNGGLALQGGTWHHKKIVFKTRNFGKFTLARDSLPPTIRPVKVTKEELRFYIKDERSGLNNFTATLNGQWILMNYDHKRNLIWAEKLDRSIPFSGDLRLSVTDMAGNETVYTSKL